MGRCIDFSCAVFFCLSTTLLAQSPPNIVIITTGDVQYGEWECQGGKYATPAYNELAQLGVTCTSAYNPSPLMLPTRAGIVTGRYPTRYGVEFNNVPKKQLGLPTTQKTLADRLRRLGYATGFFGTWDLGIEQYCFYPTSRGFDVFYGINSANPHQLDWIHDSKSPTANVAENQYHFQKYPFHLPISCAKRAVEWMNQEDVDRPVFLWLSLAGIHDDMPVSQEYLDRFKKLPPNERAFAAKITAIDDAILMILGGLRDAKKFRFSNTLFFVLSDRTPPDVGGAPMSEQRLRAPLLIERRDYFPAGSTYAEVVSSLDIVPTAVEAAVGACDDVDGVALSPYLTNEIEKPPHDALFWRQGAEWAVRQGPWKLVGNTTKHSTSLYLSDATGFKEVQDRPEMVSKLQTAWEEWNRKQVAPIWQEDGTVAPAHPSEAVEGQ